MGFLSGRFRAFFTLAAVFVFALLNIYCSSSPSPGEVESKGGKIKLRFTPEVGAVSKYKGSHTREMNFHGLDIRIINTYRVVHSVKSKTDKGSTIRIKCLEQDTKMVKDGETQTFQSPVKAVGKTIEVEVSSVGEVESVKGFIPGLSKDELKNFAEDWFFELPEEPCGIGESWRKEIDDSTETRVAKGVALLTLKGFDSKNGIKVACISGSAEVDVTGKTGQGTIKGIQKSTFEAKIAIEGGFLVTVTIKSELKGKMTGINPETAKEETRDIASFSHNKIEFIE
jgi:hypothetical protein